LIIREGSILVSHPVYAHKEQRNSIVYVTESTENSTVGITLNQPMTDMRSLMQQKNVDWSWDHPVFRGGDVNANALIMLHSDEWYSSNTMTVGNNLAISSDGLMLEKLDMGNHPHWFKLVLGCRYWEPAELGHVLKGKRPRWLLLPQPSNDLICDKPERMWKHAVAECSQSVFASYF